jgi:hypothetical protein
MKDRSREIRQPLVAPSFFQERERTPISQHFRLETSDGITVVTFSDAKVMPETKDPLYGLVEDERHRRRLNLSNARFPSFIQEVLRFGFANCNP